MDPSIPKEVRGKTDALDALGNTTAATGKGFAIASAVLTSLSLMQAFKKRVSPDNTMIFEVDHPTVLSGILLGSMMPMLFAAYSLAPCAHHVPPSAKYPACPKEEYHTPRCE